MALKQECPFCKERTVAKRLLGFYVGSTEQLKLWECRSCNGIWSKSHHKLIGLNEHHCFLADNEASLVTVTLSPFESVTVQATL